MTVSNCQICNCTSFTEFTRDNGFIWETCVQCGFARINPMPTIAESLGMQNARLAHGYITGFTEKIKKKQRRARTRIKRMIKHMNGDMFLDLGCNIGVLTNEARLMGLNAFGLDVNAHLIEYARSHYPECTFFDKSIEELATQIKFKFDGIYCSEVIEHVPDPGVFASAVAQLLNKGGVMYLTTPDFRQFSEQNKEKWPSLSTPEHKIYFNPKNIKMLFQRHGFDKIKMIPNFNLKYGIKLLAWKA